MKKTIFIQILTLISLANATGKENALQEELEVILQFFEFELEDICILKNEINWEFLTGSKNNLKQLLDLELREAELFKNESEMLQNIDGNTFSSKRLQRLYDIFLHPGASLLGTAELKEYKEYSIKLQEINSKITIGCKKEVKSEDDEVSKIEVTNENFGCMGKNAKEVSKILMSEKDEFKLKSIWSEWFEELKYQNQKTRFDFIQQLSILDMEAEQNEEDDLSDYWLKQSDIRDLDYHKISLLWKEIIPLYQKIRKYMANILVQNYGNKVFIDKKLFPAHLMGSLDIQNWIMTAEKLEAFQISEPYKVIKLKLKEKNMLDLYKMADNFTSEVKIGNLPTEFYSNSQFNVTSPYCEGKILDYCSRKNTFRAISCSDEEVTITSFLKVHEDVAKMKHLLFTGRETLEEDNGFLFREGPRNSVIYEAVAGLSSLLAIRPTNLRKQNLLPNVTLPNEEILSLFLSALYIIPSLPYYLAADLWRINALKEMDVTAGETAYESTSVSALESSTLSFTTEDDSSREIEKRDTSSDCDNCEENKNETVKDESQNISTSKLTDVTNVTLPQNYLSTIAITTMTPKIYDFENLTRDWWKYREQLQGVGNADGKLFPDFLQDKKIIWNKPYVSKFMGAILQFQLLEYFKSENFSTNTAKIQLLLRKGKSEPYHEILEEMFNITEISTKPLLQYFKPLEDFLDSGGKFINENASSDPYDLSLFSQSYSMNSSPIEQIEKPQQDSNTIVFALLILTALGLISVTIFVVWKRYRRKQRAKERRKRLNEIIN